VSYCNTIRLSFSKRALLSLFVLPGACLSVRNEFVDTYINIPDLQCPGGKTTKSTRTCGGTKKKIYIPDLAKNNNSAVVYFGIEVICSPTVFTVGVRTHI